MTYYWGRQQKLGVIEHAKKKVSESKGDGRNIDQERHHYLKEAGGQRSDYKQNWKRGIPSQQLRPFIKAGLKLPAMCLNPGWRCARLEPVPKSSHPLSRWGWWTKAGSAAASPGSAPASGWTQPGGKSSPRRPPGARPGTADSSHSPSSFSSKTGALWEWPPPMLVRGRLRIPRRQHPAGRARLRHRGSSRRPGPRGAPRG